MIKKEKPEIIRTPTTICDTVWQLENALSFVADECKLAHPVAVNYGIVDGEGFIWVDKVENSLDSPSN